MNKALTLFSAFHKPYLVPRQDFIEPIQTGRAVSTVQLDMRGDDTGNNISSLNPHFCELTVLYHVWKNYPADDVTYWGLCHYRRYFVLPQKRFFIERSKPTYAAPPGENSFARYINPALYAALLKMLEQGNTIVASPYRTGMSNEAFYKQEHDGKLWDLVRVYIKERHPSFLIYFEKMAHADYMYPCNMMIAGRATWDAYLTLLFDILLIVHKQYLVPGYPYEARAAGFMAERIHTAYILYLQATGRSVQQLPFLFLE